MEGGQYNLRTVEEVFRDFQGRRLGLIKALTTDVEEFYVNAILIKKENLCLYGFPNELWEVNLPAEEVPRAPRTFRWFLPPYEHVHVNWRNFDKFTVKKDFRKRLFIMINELPTLFEVVPGTAEKQTKEKSSVSNHSSNKKSISKGRASEHAEDTKALPAKEKEEGLEEEEEDEEHGDTLCGACGENYASDEFWICCDVCENWCSMVNA